MTNSQIIRIKSIVLLGLLIFGMVSFNSSGHELAVMGFMIRYISIPVIILSIVTTILVYKRTRRIVSEENEQKPGLIDKIKTGTILTIITVLIGLSYFLSIKALIELTNKHLGQQRTFKIEGRIIEKDSIDNRKDKTYYLKIKDTSNNIIDIRVSQNKYENYDNGDLFAHKAKKGSLGFIYTDW